MNDTPRRAATALLALLTLVLTTPARSADADGEWQPVAPPTSSTQPISTTPEGGFSNPERVIFVERLRERVLDQLCRNVKLKYDYNFGSGDFSGTGLGMKRYLGQMPDRKLAIVDEESLRVGAGHTFPWEIAEGVTAGLWIGGRIEGKSMVVRPIDGVKTCAEMDRLVDLRDIKTVLPFTADRIAAMQVGELWRIPMNIMVGHSESLGWVPADALSVSISFTGHETGAGSMTLYRLGEDKLRIRFRLDRAEVRVKGANLVKTIPAIEFASLGTNILAELVDRELAKQLRDYTMASLGWAHSRTNGKRVILEYIVDPRDPEQAHAVQKSLRGDLRDLVHVGLRLAAQRATDESSRAYYLQLMKDHDTALGPSSYASLNEYTNKARSIRLKIPFLMEHAWNSAIGSDRMTRLTDPGGQFLFNRADKTRNSEYFDFPWVGPLVKDNNQRDVQVVTYAEPGKPHGEPMAVYLQQHGFLRATGSAVNERVDSFNSIMRLAGTRGRGENAALEIPIGAFPAPPPPPSDFDRRAGDRGEPANQKGMVSFTLVFNQKAVSDAINAAVDDVLRSYAATQDRWSRPMADWLVENARVAAGKIEYDRGAARRRFGGDALNRHENQDQELNSLAWMAREASGLLMDLEAARTAPDAESRAAAVARLIGGRGESGLAYEEVIRVLVQLVDPKDLTGDFYASLDRPKTAGGDATIHMRLKKDRPDNPLLQSAGEAKNRFAEPSILLD